MSKIHQVGSYIHYWLNAVGRHSLQAPFVFDLYDNVIKSRSAHQDFHLIERFRDQFKESSDLVRVGDHGAGSHFSKTNERAVRDIASKGVTRKKYAAMLYRLCHYLNAANIVELGTSLGITTLYLSIRGEARVTTFEGSPALCDIAEKVFRHMMRKNINIVPGNIDDTLSPALAHLGHVDLAFVDANHLYQPTINYFTLLAENSHSGTCLVFDDIHWSKEMEAAWKTIKAHPKVTLSLDLYQMGLVFFNPDLRKQDYVLEF